MSRRFISGAQCPSCGQLDKLVVYVVDDRDHFECIACGHTQKRPTIDELQKEQEENEASSSMEPQVVQLKNANKNSD